MQFTLASTYYQNQTFTVPNYVCEVLQTGETDQSSTARYVAQRKFLVGSSLKLPKMCFKTLGISSSMHV